MNIPKLTLYFIIVTVVSIAVFDVFAALRGFEWTISSALLEIAKKWPVVPFIIGFLFGHIFFPNRSGGA